MEGRPYEIKDDPWSSHGIILARLGAGAGRRVLDVGAADGFLSERLAAAGWRVTALERDAGPAAVAGRRAHDVVVADLEQGVPSLPGPFDAIVCGDVLEHLSDPLGVLRGLTGHLAAGGVVLVSVPNVAHLWIRLSLLAGRFEYTDRGILDRTHLRHFTRRTLVEMLRDADLAVIELTATAVPLALIVPERLHGRWLTAVQRLAAATARGWKGGLAYQFVAICRPDGAPAPSAPRAAAPARPA